MNPESEAATGGVPVFSLNTGKYGPEKTPYLDTFHAMMFSQKSIPFQANTSPYSSASEYPRDIDACKNIVLLQTSRLSNISST